MVLSDLDFFCGSGVVFSVVLVVLAGYAVVLGFLGESGVALAGS